MSDTANLLNSVEVQNDKVRKLYLKLNLLNTFFLPKSTILQGAIFAIFTLS